MGLGTAGGGRGEEGKEGGGRKGDKDTAKVAKSSKKHAPDEYRSMHTDAARRHRLTKAGKHDVNPDAM